MRNQIADRLQSLHPVSRETLSRLEAYVALFEKWSRSINLAAPSTLPHIWERHILDSAQIFALNPGPRSWLDVGSGGGFPGIVTAIMLCEEDGGHVDLVESNQKKAAFLRRALVETGGRGTVHAIRIEQAQDSLKGFDAVSARAVADLDMLLDYCSPWLEQGATAYFHKGRDYRREIDKARRSWSFDLVEHTSIVDADSVILQISKPVRK